MSTAAAAVSIAVGVWLTAAPDVLGFADPAASIHHVLGPIAASLATVSLWRVARAALRANLVVGGLVAVSPIVGADAAAAVANAVACGIGLSALALVPIRGSDRFAGGWIVLGRHR